MGQSTSSAMLQSVAIVAMIRGGSLPAVIYETGKNDTGPIPMDEALALFRKIVDEGIPGETVTRYELHTVGVNGFVPNAVRNRDSMVATSKGTHCSWDAM